MPKVTKSPRSKVVTIRANEVVQPKPCRESIGTMMDGEIEIKRVGEKEDCPAPTAENKAEADSAARDNLMKYGERWCSKGKLKCDPGSSCAPTLSDIKNQGYKVERRPAPEMIACVLVATISGTVSCNCVRN